MDLFDTKVIKPMLIAEMWEPFDSPDWIYEIKLDGIRCVAYLDRDSTDLRNKRNKELLPHVPELSGIHAQVNKKCILDGELFVMKNGVTDFFEIQRRALMYDPFKIKLAAKAHPASFVAYDVLYIEGKQVTDCPLMKRKKLLSELINENNYISVSRYIEENGIRLFQATKEKGLEGIVAKRKDSKYYFDKRTKDWVKCKHMWTDDCVVCGYIRKPNNMTSLIIGQYDNNGLVYKGHVTLGVSLQALYEHSPRETDTPPFKTAPEGNTEAVWLVPELVCIVESMPSDMGGFRQPVYKGIRDDKAPEDCKIRELK
ncbi:MAG: DNA ligase [Lachnospiraceae bacterium]